jgi:hypothetical protein
MKDEIIQWLVYAITAVLIVFVLGVTYQTCTSDKKVTEHIGLR